MASARGFSLSTLVALYDQSVLVPFIGSGVSTGPCVDWATMVDALRAAAGLNEDASLAPGIATADLLARRAASAILSLACQRKDRLAEVLRDKLYSGQPGFGRNELLAKLYWPLVCTTNYDDTYLGARVKVACERMAARLEHDASEVKVDLPRVLGRSETDCRRVMQHLSMPAGEVYWAIQGMLSPRDEVRSALLAAFGRDKAACAKALPSRPELESELVIGPVEYRAAANMAQHFRRAFAELFYHRSLLFLGSGLGEPYFLALFDEIIEFLGPPPRPHFALVDENRVDPDFLRVHYNIVCRTYNGPAEYGKLDALLAELEAAVNEVRPRPMVWGLRMDGSSPSGKGSDLPHFSVVRRQLPNRADAPDECLVISLGRDDATEANPRGRPVSGSMARRRSGGAAFDWCNDWVVAWAGIEGVYGVVARQLWERNGGKARDLRSAEAVRASFRAMLELASTRGFKVVRTQLLAAGRLRVFQPSVSLAQMARAYGEWHAAWRKGRDGAGEPLRVVVHVVTEDVLAQLRSGQLSLAERLHLNTELRFTVEVIDLSGRVHSEHLVMDEDASLDNVKALLLVPGVEPAVGMLPTGRPNRLWRALSFQDVLGASLRDFGIVTGSTLLVNYRSSWGHSAAT